MIAGLAGSEKCDEAEEDRTIAPSSFRLVAPTDRLRAHSLVLACTGTLNRNSRRGLLAPLESTA